MKCIATALGFLLSVGIAAPGPVHAQERPQADQNTATAPVPQPHREGEYGGVLPGAAPTENYKNKRPRTCRRKNLLTWIGFQVKQGGDSRLFAQLCGSLQYEQALVGNILEVTLVGARYGSRNVQRALDPRFFETPILRVTSRRVRRSRAKGNRPAHRSGIRLSIEFKNPADAAEATASIATEQDGFTYLFLDFGPPSEAGAPAAQAPTGSDTPDE